MTGAPAPALLKGHLVNLSGPRQKLTPSCMKQQGKESTRSLSGLLCFLPTRLTVPGVQPPPLSVHSFVTAADSGASNGREG